MSWSEDDMPLISFVASSITTEHAYITPDTEKGDLFVIFKVSYSIQWC